jgi:hypothetical protein
VPSERPVCCQLTRDMSPNVQKRFPIAASAYDCDGEVMWLLCHSSRSHVDTLTCDPHRAQFALQEDVMGS